MGTTRTGRVLNTTGAKGTVSQYALVHADEGGYTKPRKKDPIRLKSGGHGQTGMKQLDKYGIRYKVEKTYPNGVRVGYILDHTDKKKKASMGQSWFPESWTKKDIKRAGEHVMGLKANRHVPNGTIIYGMWKGVRVGLIKTNGQPGTVFPDAKQPNKKNKKKGKKQ